MPLEEGGQPLALYADPGYSLSERIFMPYPDGRHDEIHSAFNQSMASNRITVEYGHARTQMLWKALNFSSNMQMFKSPITAMYVCAVMFTNAVTCFDGGNIVSNYFNCPPPSLCSLFLTLNRAHDTQPVANAPIFILE